MKRTVILTIAMTTLLSCTCYARPQYSPETLKLMQEAGIEYNTPVDEVMNRQESLKGGKANKTTTTTNKTRKTANKSLKSHNDEYRVVSGGSGVKVTDTYDGLHIYSDSYNSPSNYGAKYSTDEFRVYGQYSPANDGHDESTWGELHINRNYLQNVYYEPEKDRNRLGTDEYRLPWQMN